jgi:hypothetical protein
MTSLRIRKKWRAQIPERELMLARLAVNLSS